jgi:hypothetical protein
VIGQESEFPPFEQESEMSDRCEGGQQFPIEGGVPGLSDGQLSGEEC